MTAVETTTIERPTQERYQTLVNERQKASNHLAECEFLADLEATPGPEGLGYANLLDFRFPKSKNPGIPRGVKLAQQIVGTTAVIAVIDDELKVWNEEEEQYLASVTPEATPEAG